MGPTARWLLADGLPTQHTAPTAALDAAAFEALWASCSDHSLQGLLIAAVAANRLPATAEQRARVAELELSLTVRRAAYDDAILGPLELLDQAGIEVRLLKGAALRHCDYPDEQLRPTTDLDLLVRGDSIDAAVATLVAAGGHLVNPEPAPGFRSRVGKGATVSTRGGPEVDLHRLLTWGPFGVRLPPEELWRTARPCPVGDTEWLTLGREETLLHLCAHLLVLGDRRAREWRDVAQLLLHPDLDPVRARFLATRWGQQTLLATAVRGVSTVLAIDPRHVPLHDWAVGYHAPVIDRLWERMERPDDPLPGLEQVAVLAELRGARARALLVRANVAPLPDTDAPALRRLANAGRALLRRR